MFGDGVLASLRNDPTWPHPARAISEANDRTRRWLTDYITDQVGDDPSFLAKVLPDYPPYGKRMLIDHGWSRALGRPDVECVADPIGHIEPGAVVMSQGRHEVDVIVAATGFHADRVLWPMQVTGRDGVELQQRWGDDPQAYLGTVIVDCPNLFVVYGPRSMLAHGGSAFHTFECQVDYALACLGAMAERDWTRLEIGADTHDAYNEAVDVELEHYVWTHSGMRSWDKNRHGRVTTNLPWRLVDYWHRTRQPDLNHFMGS